MCSDVIDSINIHNMYIIMYMYVCMYDMYVCMYVCMYNPVPRTYNVALYVVGEGVNIKCSPHD